MSIDYTHNTDAFHLRLEFLGVLISTNPAKNDCTSFLYTNHHSGSLTALDRRQASLLPGSLPQIPLGIPRDCPHVPQIRPAYHLLLPPRSDSSSAQATTPCCPEIYSPGSCCCLNITPGLGTNLLLIPPSVS